MNESSTGPRPKHPWLAAVLNFALPGLGYLYLGSKRNYFSVGLLLAGVVSVFSPALWSSEVDLPLLVGGVIFAAVFAVDAYEDAKETRPVEDA